MCSDDDASPSSKISGKLDTKLQVGVKLDTMTKLSIKSAQKSDICTDSESDEESDIDFDLNPDLKSDGKPETKEEEKFPKCKPGSSTLPFTLGTEKIFINWIDPCSSSGRRKNNCIILLDRNSEERTAVADNFLQSVHEGSEKLEEEMSRTFDSAAGEVILFVIVSVVFPHCGSGMLCKLMSASACQNDS